MAAKPKTKAKSEGGFVIAKSPAPSDRPGALLKADTVTLVIKAEKDGKLRVSSSSWMEPAAIMACHHALHIGHEPEFGAYSLARGSGPMAGSSKHEASCTHWVLNHGASRTQWVLGTLPPVGLRP